MNKAIYSALGAAALLSCNAAMADIRFNGFASMYVGQTLDDDETLYGYDDDLSFKNESLFGIQATADLMDGLTATAQILARGRNDYEADFEWAYLTYSVNDEFSISAGRLRLPLFKYSEYLDVGYAFPWARTPRDVYDIDFNTYEGIRLNYTTSKGWWDISVQGVYGSFDQSINVGGNLLPTQLDDIVGISLDLTRDWFSFRAGYTLADATIEAGLGALEPLFVGNRAAFDEVDATDDSSYFGSIGAFIDYNDWLINVEKIQFESEDNLTIKVDAYYAMLGRRFGDFTVAYTYSEYETENDFSAVNAIPGFIPNPNPGTEPFCGATAQDFVRRCVLTQESENSTHNLTLRWNFHPAAAFTVDYTEQESDVLGGLPADKSDKLVTMGVDLVF